MLCFIWLQLIYISRRQEAYAIIPSVWNLLPASLRNVMIYFWLPACFVCYCFYVRVNIVISRNGIRILYSHLSGFETQLKTFLFKQAFFTNLSRPFLWQKITCNNNNILYSSQREIKAVVRSYTLTHNQKLNCTYLDNSVIKHTILRTVFQCVYYVCKCCVLAHWVFVFQKDCAV